MFSTYIMVLKIRLQFTVIVPFTHLTFFLVVICYECLVALVRYLEKWKFNLFIGGFFLSLCFDNASGGLQSGFCTQTLLHSTITSSSGMKTWESRTFMLISETTSLILEFCTP